MFKKLLFFIFFLSLPFSVGCKKENPNPELLDPIYLDLVKDHGEKLKELETERKSTEGLIKDLNKALPRTSGLKNAKKAISKNLKNMTRLEQLVKYYEIRKEHRRLLARKNYRIAFHKGEVWPDPSEKEAYFTNKRLKSADMNWQSRVPKLFKANPNYVPVGQEAK